MVRRCADVAGEIVQAGLPPATLFSKKSTIETFFYAAEPQKDFVSGFTYSDVGNSIHHF